MAPMGHDRQRAGDFAMIGRWMRAALAAAMLLGAGIAEARTVRWAASGDPNTMDPHSQNVGTVTMVLPAGL
jgi:hypothetical protein